MTKSKLLELVSEQYDNWLCSQKEQTSAYSYEKGFDEMWTDLGKMVLQNSLGKLPQDRRKKKDADQIWGNSST